MLLKSALISIMTICMTNYIVVSYDRAHASYRLLMRGGSVSQRQQLSHNENTLTFSFLLRDTSQLFRVQLK